MPNQQSRRQWYYVYALVTGVVGILLLAYLFAQLQTTIDLFTALLFTVVALVVSYFRVPIRDANSEIGLDGAVLLGATLLGGAALGGWVAFIAGLLKSFFPRPTGRGHWFESSATALWSSGRNVLSVAAAWAAYSGLGGTLAPVSVNTSLALAIVVLCVVFALVRCFVAWPAIILQSPWSKRALANAVSANTFFLELAPLPSALLISATFAVLGCSFFLILALVFIGLGAVMKRMLDTIGRLQEQRDELAFADQVSKAFARSSPDVHALCEVAYQLCADLVPAARFEIGLYDSAAEQLRIELAVYNEGSDDASSAEELPAENGQPTKLPPMHLPVTPLWEWIREQQEPVLLSTQQAIEELPFSLPLQDREEGPPSLMIAPLVESPDLIPPAEDEEPGSEDTPQPGATQPTGAENEEPCPVTVGAITVQAAGPGAYSAQDLAYVAIVAEGLSAALQRGARATVDVR